MARTQYGTTWWGKQWLSALSEIDFDNRIPRGKTYANTGRVLSFSINEHDHVIKAKVEGNYEPFYRVKISLPAISENQHKKLIREIARSPLVIAKLSTRKLDPEVLSICNRIGIKLFPQRWNDLDMRCSCPDYAVPCKHIAAVIYKISQEIDANPFILFTLRGIDLIEDLRKEGVKIERAVKAELPTWKELMGKKIPYSEDLVLDEFDVATAQGRKDWLDKLASLTYSTIEFDATSLEKILTAAPAGYVHGDLRELIKKVLAQASKLAHNQIQNVSERTPPLHNGEHSMLCINTWGQTRPNQDMVWQEWDVVEKRLCDRRVGARRADGTVVKLHEMFSGYLNSKRLADSPEAIEALYDAWLLASKLTEASAVIPQIFEPSDSCFVIRWIPAVSNHEIQSLTTRLGNLFSAIDSKYFEILGNSKIPEPQPVGEVALGIFIQSYINTAFEKYLSSEVSPLEQRALFASEFVDCEDDQIAEAAKLRLADWLSPFTIARSKLLPILTVHDLYDEEKKATSTEEAFARPISIELGFELEGSKKFSSEYGTFEKFMSDQTLEAYKFDAMRISAKLTDYCPELSELLQKLQSQSALTMEELTPLLFDSLPALSTLGVRVILPRSLKHLLSPSVGLELDIDKEWKEDGGLLGLASLLTFDWRIAVGDRKISPEEFRRLSLQAGQVVRFHDSFMFVDPNQISQIQKRLAGKDVEISKLGLVRAALTGKIGSSQVLLSAKVKDALKRMFKDVKESLPKAVNAQLRDYQERGYQWLLRNMQIGVGSILADDMGLGKTLQVLTVLEKLRDQKQLNDKPALIVVPTTLLTNWQREAEKFTPKLKLSFYYGSSRDIGTKGAHVIVTTYGTMRRAPELKKRSFKLLVLDEAQAIKNHKTATFKSIKQIKAEHCIAMSGTPVENRLLEYWSIMEAVNPGLFGTERQFKTEFADPIEVRRDKPTADRFKLLTGPFIMRRLKSDKSIIKDLPEKISVSEFCVLTSEQAMLYRETVNKAMNKVKAGANQFERTALVLQMIIQLKQICNAPLQYEKSSPYNKAEYSGKMQRLFAILDELLEAERKVLIFTQFKEMGKLLQKWIGEHTGREPLFIHGGLSVKKRQECVDAFQNDRREKVMVLSLKAAGTGLNLTAASAVIHYDLWWNPAVEAQATDRAYRIGQKQAVTVYRFITANTFEEKINRLIESKKALAEMTVATGEHWITDLTDSQLEEVFSLEDK